MPDIAPHCDTQPDVPRYWSSQKIFKIEGQFLHLHLFACVCIVSFSLCLYFYADLPLPWSACLFLSQPLSDVQPSSCHLYAYDSTVAICKLSSDFFYKTSNFLLYIFIRIVYISKLPRVKLN